MEDVYLQRQCVMALYHAEMDLVKSYAHAHSNYIVMSTDARLQTVQCQKDGWMDERVLGHFFALSRLNWAGIKRLIQRCLYSQTDPHTSNGRHLVSCEDWQCSSMYKCYATYCIPVHYICDRVWDCPSCEDEHGCITDRDNVIMPCPGMVKCKKGYPCVHKYHVRDGEPQCVDTHDDEFMSPPCPAKCSCHGTYIDCVSFMNVSIQEFTAISATNNDFVSLLNLQEQWAFCVDKCPSVYYLDVSNISSWNLNFMLSLKSKIESIHILNISYNEISVITPEVIDPVKSLIYLYMSQCSISSTEPGVFIATTLQVMS